MPENILQPMYNNEDEICGIISGDIPYYFVKNLQGDVIAITDHNGEVVARYSYDAWGVCTITLDTEGIGSANPFRYRGYYYDSETSLYYLQSRYYDANVGRFVNGDEATFILNSANIYTYCNNNPIMLIDTSGFAATYSGIVGFGIQVMFSANVFYHQGFIGFEAVWFNKKNNFGNGFIPWCFWFTGGSFGFTLDFNKLLSPNLLTNPKNVIAGFGLNFNCSMSVTCFLVTGNKMRDPNDYKGGVSFWTGTVYGVTVSKSWSSRASTYGVGLTWEIGIRGWKISLGKKLFGTCSGYSNYRMIYIGKNARSLYNTVKGRV